MLITKPLIERLGVIGSDGRFDAHGVRRVPFVLLNVRGSASTVNPGIRAERSRTAITQAAAARA